MAMRKPLRTRGQMTSRGGGQSTPTSVLPAFLTRASPILKRLILAGGPRFCKEELACNYKKSYIQNGTEMKYEWDEAKDRKNVAKHGLSFEDAPQVFSGPCVTFEDDRCDYGEERLITLGLLAGRLVVIAHSPRDEGTRIISMRKGNRREQKIYQKRLGTN